jgi:hypothetical protein
VEDSGGIWAHNDAVADADPVAAFTPAAITAALGGLAEVIL